MSSHEGQDRLEIKTGGGCLFFFGMPFLLVGLVVLFKSDAVHFKGPNGNELPDVVGILFGAVFAIVGCVIMFGRSGTIIDRRHGTITT